MAFTLGQHTFANPATGAQSLAYASNVTAGNLLVVTSSNFNGAATITTPFANTGTAGVQTWHPLLTTPFQSSAATSTSQMWWTIASGTGSCTCTVTWSVSTFGEIYVSEFSGSSISAALTQDGAGQHSDGTLATINLPSITTTRPDDLIIGYIVGGVTVASPYVQLDTQGGDLFFYRAGVGAGTYPAAGGYATQTSGAYSSVVAALGIPRSVSSTFPVYLPRRLGPAAVGPTFFAPFPPAAPGISPSPGGLLGTPAYLPRRLGPGAVGPPFFARFPVPAPGASAGVVSVWVPTFISPNSTFY